MEIIKANQQTIKEVINIEQLRFKHDSWTEKQWLYELNENEFATILVATEENQVLGYIDYWILFEQATINKICVKENVSHQGIGSALLKKALENIDKALCVSTSLEVRVSNIVAKQLYEKNYFKTILKKDHYYNDGEDCYFMIRSIGDIYER